VRLARPGAAFGFRVAKETIQQALLHNAMDVKCGLVKIAA